MKQENTEHEIDLSKIKAVLVDADDTLWENNLFFLQSLEWLCQEGRRLGFTDKAVLEVMNKNERFHIRRFGYGYDCFERSVILTAKQLTQISGRPTELPRLIQRGKRWVNFLRQHPIIFMPGVGDVLPKLAKKFPTYIVTKGNHHDQMSKVYRSGLLATLQGAHVVPHKYAHNYQELLDELSLKPEEAIMIGNSPASDINNPKKLGIQTIFVPHKQTWTMELEPISPAYPKTIHIPHFGALADLFKLPL